MAFPQTILPLVSEILIDGAWINVTTDIERDDGNGIRINRKPLSWAEQVAPTTAAWTFKNASGNYYDRNPNSIYHGKLGRNTQCRHRLRPLYDTFTRSASSSWGSPDYGPAWVTSGGSASDHSVSGGLGNQSMGSVNVERTAKMAISRLDFDVTFDITNPSTPLSDVFERGVRARWVDASNFIDVRVYFQTDNSVSLIVRQLVAGVETHSGFLTIAGITTTSQISGRFSADGDVIHAKLWTTGTAEPTDWQRELSGVTHLSVGTFEFYSLFGAGVTNGLPQVQTWDNIQISDYRFWGEIPSFTPLADQSSSYRSVPVTAAGLGQRLGAGARPLASALTRAMAGVSEGDFVPIAFWPMEDGADATQFGSAFTDQLPAVPSGDVSKASFSGYPGSLPVPVINAGGSIAANFPVYTDTGEWQQQFLIMFPSGWTGDADILIIKMRPGNTVAQYKLTYIHASLALRWTAYSAAGAVMDTDDNIATWERDVPYLCSVTDWVTGGDHLTRIGFWSTEGVQLATITSVPDGPGAGHAGMPASIVARSTTTTPGLVFGELALYNGTIIATPSIGPNAQAAGGYLGELAGVRMPRLAREEGIAFELIGDADDTEPCGVQLPGALLTILLAAADADQGVLYEARDALTLRYRTRKSLYNTRSICTLSQTGTKDLSAFVMVDDFRSTRNKITARRTGGSFATAEITVGRTSTAEPPDGIGIIPEDLSWSLGDDSQLFTFAGWRAHRGGWDEPRYTGIGVQRHRSPIYGVASLDAAVLALDLASYYTLTNMRSDLPPDNVELLAQGYDETIANFEHAIVYNNVPYGPYRIMTMDDSGTDRLGGEQILRTAVNTSATAWDIATTDGPLLITDDAADGWSWMIDGEKVTVTDVAASLVTFGAAGTADSGSSGSRTPGKPATTVDGNLVLIFASTRNSGTGVPDTPAGWARLPVFEAASCAQVFCRIYDSAVWTTMPTVTFTGGAANEDTIAQSARIAGKFHDATNVMVDSASCLNAVVAQNIQYPGLPLTNLVDNCIVFYVGWKQDDYTSVATIAGATEIQEASSTAGNDASQIWDYVIQTTAAGIPAGVFTVTGGATAISRGAVFAIRCDYQGVTVTRSINGISKAHSAGAIPRLSPQTFMGL